MYPQYLWWQACEKELSYKKNFRFQTYEFKRQIRGFVWLCYLMWMDLCLLDNWSIREQAGSCLLYFHDTFQQSEIRERLWMLNVCTIMGVQVLTATLKPWLLKRFPIIDNEWVEALRHTWGKVSVEKVRCSGIMYGTWLQVGIPFRISVFIDNVFW